MSNENDGQNPTEEVKEPEPPKQNTSRIENGVMTITLYLEVEGDDFTFQKAIGGLELSKDLVKNYFGQKAMVEQAMKQRNKLITPIVH
jgi:hypothetical protein